MIKMQVLFVYLLLVLFFVNVYIPMSLRVHYEQEYINRLLQPPSNVIE